MTPHHHAMVGAGHAAYTDQFHELARLVLYLVTLENKRIERCIYGITSQICEMVAAMEPMTTHSSIQKSGVLTDEAISNGSLRKNNETRGNGRELRQGGNHPNQAMAIEGGQGHEINGNPARRRAFVMGADFVSTTFIPLLDIEPSNLGFSYEIEIASEQLVEINKVIRGCKLEIEGHTFNINLIPFGHGSFDIIIGMDWLSRNKAEIVFHEKVVRIPLPHCEMLRVLGERSEEKVRHLMSTKAKEQKLKDIVVVRNFSKVQFLGHVINGDGIHVDPGKIKAVKNWEAPRTPS
ncbi:putative reverse transcriptase domain-containing protein [Tanacetum coccineum]|uniref:Reverse transcriptase domain-containing protein n=1 Tax=Tanacetum coccineum TaxID=301880 RepID=A0ABQ5AFF1_9ASTR